MKAKVRLSGQIPVQADALMRKWCDFDGLSHSELVSKAIRLFAAMREAQEHGGALYVAERKGAELTRVKYL